MRHTRRLVAGALIVASLLLVGCGRAGGDSSSAASGTAITSLGLTVFAPEERPELPTVSGVTLDGGYADLASLRGQVVVLNSWASWCEPCKEELPVLVALADSAAPGVVFVGLDVNDRTDEALAMVQTYSIPYPSIIDPDATILLTIPTVPPEAVPSTVVIDKQGRVAARVIGTVKPGMLEPVLADLVKE